MRIHGLLLALLLGAGCNPPDTIVRLAVRLGSAPAPQRLRVTLFENATMLAPPTTIAPVTLPGTIVLHDINPALPEVCVALEGLAGDGSVSSRGAVIIGIVPGMTANSALELGGGGMLDCTTPSDGGARDLGDGGSAIAHDLAGSDLLGTNVAICPAGSYFCDDFESGNVNKWTETEIHYDAGAQLSVQQSIVRHGQFALHATAAGHDMGGAGHTIVIKEFGPLTPPVAVRANVFAQQPLDHFGVSVELYDDGVHGFAVAADDADVWTITEDQATGGAVDRHADMVPFNSGAWHCVELVVDAGGEVSLFIDNHALIGPFPRMTAVSYTTLQMGVGRTVNPVNDVYIDDVAVGPTRLYCP